MQFTGGKLGTIKLKGFRVVLHCKMIKTDYEIFTNIGSSQKYLYGSVRVTIIVSIKLKNNQETT